MARPVKQGRRFRRSERGARDDPTTDPRPGRAGVRGRGLTAADRKPNVIVIVADDMGYADAWKAWNTELVDLHWG
ncbi:MAG TPA: hypothetical protein VFG68_20290 [Fimbriiglobus sp.]|nr:hypothetical protein [Fimbriiglobus sp.]